MFGSYQGWVDAVAGWLDVDEANTLAQVPTFIKLAEHDMNRQCRLKEQLKCVFTDIDSDGVLTLPGDFAQMQSVHLTDNGRVIEAVTPNEFYRVWEQNFGSAAEPEVYAIIGEGLNFAPTGSGRQVKIWYWREVPHIDASTYPSIFTEYAPEALLAGACMHGSRYIVEDDRFPQFKAQFDEAIAAGNADAQNDALGSSPLRIRFGGVQRGRRYGRYWGSV